MGIFSTHILFILNHAGLAFLIFTAISAVKTEDGEVKNVYNSVYIILIMVNKYIYFKSYKINEYIDCGALLVYKYVYGLSIQVHRKA
jgi:hypothetical protein